MDGSARLLNTAERDSSGGWFSKEDTKPGAARSLRMFMESFVTEKFLPEIYLDFRYGLISCIAPGPDYQLMPSSTVSLDAFMCTPLLSSSFLRYRDQLRSQMKV